MIKWIKSLFKQTPEDEKLAKTIINLCKKYDVRVISHKYGGWSVELRDKFDHRV